MAKLILKDKTEIEVVSHYGTTFVIQIENFAQLDDLRSKLSEDNTSIMTVKDDDTVSTLTDLKLQGINTDFTRNQTGSVVGISVAVMFQELSELEKFKKEITSRVDVLSDLIKADMEEDKNE